MNAAGLLFGLASGFLIGLGHLRGRRLGHRTRGDLRHHRRPAGAGPEARLALRQVHRQHPRPLRRDLRLPGLRLVLAGHGLRRLPRGRGLCGLAARELRAGARRDGGGHRTGGLMQRAERLVLHLPRLPARSTPGQRARHGRRGPPSSGSWASSRSRRSAPPFIVPWPSPVSSDSAATVRGGLSGCALGAARRECASLPFAAPGGPSCPNRSYPVKERIAERAHVRGHGGVPAALPAVARQPGVVLGRAGEGAHLVPPVAVGVRRRLRRGRLRLVLGRPAERLLQLRRPPPEPLGERDRDHLGPGRARRSTGTSPTAS